MINALQLSETEILVSEAKIEFLHKDKAEFNSAYKLRERASVLLKLPMRYGTKEATLEIFDEACTNTLHKSNATWQGREGNFDHFKFEINTSSLGAGLYFLKISISNLLGTFYAHKCREKLFFKREEPNSLIQLTVSDFKYNEPENLYGGIIYHIFVDRFKKSGKTATSDGAVSVDDWSAELPEYPEYPGAEMKNNYFYGGDLFGVIEKLPYLHSLGVSTIYLSPIFKSPSNHKYDTADYMTVDECFGGDEALSALIKKAKKYSIDIILDGVFNHTGADSIYFNKFANYSEIGAYQSKSSKFYPWFDFKSYPDDYTAWWGIEILPRINPDEPSCKEFFVGKDGVIAKYAKLGIAGFRLDVVDELSDGFVSDIKSRLNEYNSHSMLYGEVWEDASNKIAYGKRKKYYLGKELDGVMNYPLRNAIISYIKNGETELLREYFYEILPNMPKRIMDAQMNLLGSHDTERILTTLGGVSAQGKKNFELLSIRMSESERSAAKERLKTAYTILATLPGVPSIFYGDEASMEGYSDPFCRRTYPWDDADKELISYYKKIGMIRRQNDVYKKGGFKVLYMDSDLLIYKRFDRERSLITAFNNSNKAITLDFSKKVNALICKAVSRNVIIKPNSAEIIDFSGKCELKITFNY